MARLSVRPTPRAGRDRIDGWASGADGGLYLKVRVAAAPVDGQANQALLRLIAKALQRPPSRLRIVSGEAARLKQIVIEGLDQKDLNSRLDAPGADAVFGA